METVQNAMATVRPAASLRIRAEVTKKPAPVTRRGLSFLV